MPSFRSAAPMFFKLFLLLLLNLPALTNAQVFSWKDADGKTHYGSRPPPGKQAESRKLAAPPSVDVEANRKAGAEEKQKKAQETTKNTQEDQSQVQERAANCQQAKANLVAIESGQIRFTVDAKGERVALDGAVRDAEIAKARKAADSWCAPPPKPAPVPAPVQPSPAAK